MWFHFRKTLMSHKAEGFPVVKIPYLLPSLLVPSFASRPMVQCGVALMWLSWCRAVAEDIFPVDDAGYPDLTLLDLGFNSLLLKSGCVKCIRSNVRLVFLLHKSAWWHAGVFRKKVGKYLEKIYPWLLRENKWYVVVYDESNEIRYSCWLLLYLDLFSLFLNESQKY